MMETSTRSARNRRFVAIMGWGVLVGTAIILWNGRLQDSIRSVGDEPVAFVLASFSAFIGVFAWLLFNPGRRAASESPVLFFAAGATLFPPPIIGFCLMPVDSPLRGWLTFGLFLLCVIAVLSHVPDDFFGVPRGRSSYMTPIPTFDSVDDAIMSPEAAWFTFEDLTRILPDAERPSLSPRSYLQQDVPRPSQTTVRSQDKVASEVDDILGSDFDLGLLDEDLTDFDRQSRRQASSKRTSSDRQNRPTNPQHNERVQPASKATNRSESIRRTRYENDERRQLANESVFESFEASTSSKPPERPSRYAAASQLSGTSVQRKRRFQTAGKSAFGAPIPGNAASVAAASIRRQLEGKSRVNVSGQSGSGLASSSRSSLLNQTTNSTSARSRPTSSDSEIEYGTLDVHRGQQPQRSSTEEREAQSTGSSRQQDQRRKERQQQDSAEERRSAEAAAKAARAEATRAEAARAEAARAEAARAQQARQKSDEDRSSNQAVQSSRSNRVSRFEQRQQAANRPTGDRDANRAAADDGGSQTVDRKLVRQTTSRETAEELGVETKQKKRSALDIATAGILGAGAAAGLAKSDLASADEAVSAATPDLDAAASQGLFGTVRDLFNKPKQLSKEDTSEEDTTEADAFDSAVDSVQTDRKADQDVAIERTVDASGAEMVEGVAVVRFERGQKKANIHIPFSPPMKGQPEVEVECVGGEQLRLKVPMAEPYGMRIEARRSNTSEAMEAEIGFAAMAEEE